MTITAYSLSQFLDITYGLLARGVEFEAKAESETLYTITLTGGF